MDTGPSDAAGMPCPRTACQTVSEIKSYVLNSLFNYSMREARFTTSPVTLYSFVHRGANDARHHLPRMEPDPEARRGNTLGSDFLLHARYDFPFGVICVRGIV